MPTEGSYQVGNSVIDLASSNMVVRTYDGSKREVVRVFKNVVKVGLVEFEVEFTILVVFSLLLG